MPYFILSSLTARYLPMLDAYPWPTAGVIALIAKNFGPRLGVDMDVSTDTFPISGRATRNVKIMPDVVGAGFFFAFSAELRHIIEDLEPGVHQFSDKYSVFYKDGRPAEKTYYCINIKAEVRNAVIWKKSKIPEIKYISGFPDELVFDQAVIAKNHLCRLPELGRIYMSEELYKAIKKAKIKDFHYQHELIGQR